VLIAAACAAGNSSGLGFNGDAGAGRRASAEAGGWETGTAGGGAAGGLPAFAVPLSAGTARGVCVRPSRGDSWSAKQQVSPAQCCRQGLAMEFTTRYHGGNCASVECRRTGFTRAGGRRRALCACSYIRRSFRPGVARASVASPEPATQT
jgi:hypothetical protein